MQRRSARAPLAPSRDWWWIFDPRLSLRARATLWVTSTAALFTVLASWLSGSVFHRALEHQASRHFETLALQVGDKIDRTLYERYRELQLIASLDALRHASVGKASADSILTTLLTSSRDFGWVGLMAADGRVIASTDSKLMNADFSEQPWFRGAKERPFAGGVRKIPELARTLVPSAYDSDFFIDIGVPVATPTGEFGGVLAAHVRWDWAQEVQLSVVAEPALRERMSVTIYSGPNEVVLDSGNSGWTEPPTVPAVPEARRFRGALVERTAEGANYFTGYARSRGFREFRGLGWITVVRQPLERVFAPARDLRHTIFGWGLAFTGILTLGTWLISGRFTRRLRAMTTAADRLREGDVLTVLPRPRSADEFGEMCGALGTLVETLRANNSSSPGPIRNSDPPSDTIRHR